MTLQKIKKDIAEIKEAIKPEEPAALIVRYDIGTGRPDISTLPKASVYCFLPNKTPIWGQFHDYSIIILEACYDFYNNGLVFSRIFFIYCNNCNNCINPFFIYCNNCKYSFLYCHNCQCIPFSILPFLPINVFFSFRTMMSQRNDFFF